MTKAIFLLLLIVAVAIGIFMFGTPDTAQAPVATSSPSQTQSTNNLVANPEESITVSIDVPAPNEVVESPLTITGQARGFWFFEGDFPVVLTNWDGLIIAESYASAEGEWMTENFVPFTATIEFESPYEAGDPDFMRRGTLILQRDNPSGLPENDAAVEIPVRFTAN